MAAVSPRVVTLKMLAEHTGLSLATVSYALRQHPKIPADTREKVAAAAAALGYRPNPRVASLMAHIRGAQARNHPERLAFVWVHTDRAEARRNPFLRNVLAGARERAAQTGFTLDEFWTEDPGMTDRRLQEIIRARGIVGVVLSPVTTAEAAVTLDWEWRHFAAAVIGNVTWEPELHHAGHHHYLGMRTALRELAALGCARPAALIEAASNERGKNAWVGAFLTHHPAARAARRLIRVVPADTAENLGAWLRAALPDALVVSECGLLDQRGVRAAARGLPVATLYWSDAAPAGVGGIDQCYDRAAGHAVDLVVAQLNANETGVPDLPRMMLFPGRWVAPAGPKPTAARARRRPAPLSTRGAS